MGPYEVNIKHSGMLREDLGLTEERAHFFAEIITNGLMSKGLATEIVSEASKEAQNLNELVFISMSVGHMVEAMKTLNGEGSLDVLKDKIRAMKRTQFPNK